MQDSFVQVSIWIASAFSGMCVSPHRKKNWPEKDSDLKQNQQRESADGAGEGAHGVIEGAPALVS